MNFQIQSNQIYFSGKTLYPLIPKVELEEMIRKGYAYERIGRLYKMPVYAVVRSVRHYGLASMNRTTMEEKLDILRYYREQGLKDEFIRKKMRLNEKAFAKVLEEEKKSKGLLANILEKLNLKYCDVSKDLK